MYISKDFMYAFQINAFSLWHCMIVICDYEWSLVNVDNL